MRRRMLSDPTEGGIDLRSFRTPRLGPLVLLAMPTGPYVPGIPEPEGGRSFNRSESVPPNSGALNSRRRPTAAL
jgi:hypothetical protein